MNIFIYISIILIVLDISISSFKHKKLVTCLSECYYILGFFHSLLLVTSVLLMLPVMLDITPDLFKFLSFFTCGGLLFVSAAPNYLGEEHRIHFFSAIISIITALIWGLCYKPIALLGILVSLIGIINKDNWLLWVELACFLVIYIALL